MAFPFRISTPNDALILTRAYRRNPDLVHFLATMDGGHFQNVPLRDISEGVRRALELSKSGIDIYFAPAEFGSAESRKADNVVSVRGLWLDIDCGEAKEGKGYATIEIAWDALSRFCAETGIPEPTHIVLSGGGLHVHWIMTEALQPAEWKATAKKLKQLTEAWGFLADPSRTADIASVMRLPGSWNHKYSPPRLVKLIRASREFIDTATFCRKIDEAHSQYCSAPVVVETRTAVDRDQSEYGPPDLALVRTALSYLDPDCEEQEWTFTIGAVVRAVRRYPDLEEPSRKLTMEWSRGDIWHKPSEKWREPGGNGLTGEQYFDQVWNRFLREEDRDGPVITIATIFHKARLAGAPLDATPLVIPGDALSLLQGRFFLIRQAGSVWVGDRDVPDQYLRRSDANLILERVLTARCPGVPPAPIVREFSTSPLTIEYVGIYSHPAEERKNQLNVWRGWTLQPKPGDCRLILAFLRDDICDGDEEAFQYLLNWLAHLLQRPEAKPGVMIVLLGGNGTGKGTLGKLLEGMIGELFLETSDVRHVFGDHNDVLERKYVIFFDEFPRRHKEADQLKSLVTETHITVNPKNQPVRQIESFHRLIIASNAAHVKHTDRDDRRDFVLKVSDRHKDDLDYWIALYAEIDGEGAAAFMNELLERDISGVNIRQRPITKALREQKELSFDPIAEWWLDRLHAGYIRDPESGWSDFEPTDDLRAMIMDYAGVRNGSGFSRQIILARLQEMCPSLAKAQRAIIPGAARRRGRVFPSLEVARREFEAYIGHSMDWED